MPNELYHDGRTDFDFLFGRWTVENRRLRERLKGSQDWETFTGASVARPILGGIGNVDEITMQRESGVSIGFTLRLFNPSSQQWSIYWASSVHPTLDIPMIGTFNGGRGEFYSQEAHEGRAVFCRFIWSNTDTPAPQWEQALSADGGRTWETNWIMNFTREA
jgi:hypothetical protein